MMNSSMDYYFRSCLMIFLRCYNDAKAYFKLICKDRLEL